MIIYFFPNNCVLFHYYHGKLRIIFEKRYSMTFGLFAALIYVYVFGEGRGAANYRITIDEVVFISERKKSDPNKKSHKS